MAEIPRLTVDEAEPLFEIADALFCRGTNPLSRGIRIASRSPYSHVGMLAKRNGVWVCLDTLQFKGCRSLRLRQVVAANPGHWELFKANRDCMWTNFDREKAHDRMWDFDGVEYGWGSIGKASFAYLPGVRLFQKLDAFCIDDEASLKTPPFCSMAYGIAIDAGGVDMVPLLKHSMTTPGDQARSLFLKRTCILV
jgi:hypothetical protein